MLPFYYNVKCLSSPFLLYHILLPVWIWHFKAVTLNYLIKLYDDLTFVKYAMFYLDPASASTTCQSSFLHMCRILTIISNDCYAFKILVHIFCTLTFGDSAIFLSSGARIFLWSNSGRWLLGSKFHNGYWQSIFQNGLRTCIPSRSIWNLQFLLILDNTW